MLISKDMVVNGCFSQPKIFKIIFFFFRTKIAFKNVYHRDNLSKMFQIFNKFNPIWCPWTTQNLIINPLILSFENLSQLMKFWKKNWIYQQTADKHFISVLFSSDGQSADKSIHLWFRYLSYYRNILCFKKNFAIFSHLNEKQ